MCLISAQDLKCKCAYEINFLTFNLSYKSFLSLRRRRREISKSSLRDIVQTQYERLFSSEMNHERVRVVDIYVT